MRWYVCIEADYLNHTLTNTYDDYVAATEAITEYLAATQTVKPDLRITLQALYIRKQ